MATECSICLDACTQESSRTLECQHEFHKACIDAWIRKSNHCPLCKRSVDVSTMDIEQANTANPPIQTEPRCRERDLRILSLFLLLVIVLIGIVTLTSKA
jgi:hypothetical protein